MKIVRPCSGKHDSNRCVGSCRNIRRRARRVEAVIVCCVLPKTTLTVVPALTVSEVGLKLRLGFALIVFGDVGAGLRLTGVVGPVPYPFEPPLLLPLPPPLHAAAHSNVNSTERVLVRMTASVVDEKKMKQARSTVALLTIRNSTSASSSNCDERIFTGICVRRSRCRSEYLRRTIGVSIISRELVRPSLLHCR